jgi:hypothetical protein
MKKASGQAQKRRVPRISVSFPVTLWWGTKELRLQARQISQFGMLLASIARGLVGEDVEIIFESPGPSLRLSGTVLYAIESGIGIGFEGLSAEQAYSLKRFVEVRQSSVLKQ